MAKESITYRCGHERSINLLGPERERAKRREWEAARLCPACWRAEHASDASTAYVRRIPPAGEKSQWCRVEIIVAGNSYPHREALKARGYKFGEFYLQGGGIGEIMGLARLARTVPGALNRAIKPTKGWHLIFSAPSEDENGGEALISQFRAEAAWIGQQGWSIAERDISRADILPAAALVEGRQDLL